jgi:hypothetical protein
MKKLLLVLFLLLPVLSQAQKPLFTYTPSEVRQSIKDVEWIYAKWGDYKNLEAMSYAEEGMTTSYLFDKSNKCIFIVLTIHDHNLLQAFIELYNKNYIIVNDYNWKLYKAGQILLCKLNRTDEGFYYFTWSLKD